MAIDVLQAAKHLCDRVDWKYSNIELQKLIYVSHMFYLGRTKNSLVKGTFQAWDYGPVHPKLYNHIKKNLCGSSPIPEFVFSTIKDLDREQYGEQVSILDEQSDLYPPGSARRLVSKTHEEGRAWEKNYIYEERGIVIRNEDILKEYDEFEKEQDQGEEQ